MTDVKRNNSKNNIKLLDMGWTRRQPLTYQT